MNTSEIVIYTSQHDPHTDAVIGELRRAGHEPVRLNTDDLPVAAPLRLALADGRLSGDVAVADGRRVIDVERIRSVLFRRPDRYGLPDDLGRFERVFAAAEMDHALGGLWASLDCYWMSRPDTIRAASWKGEQLRRAARLGFEVPRSLLTTDPVAAREFVTTAASRVVFKSLSGPAALAGMPVDARASAEEPRAISLLTRVVGERELLGLDAVRLAPCLFQEYVEKDLELRVTVIGDDVFAAAVHSQADPGTAIDCRGGDVLPAMSAYDLPADVAQRCYDFVRSYGLTYGAIDLVVAPDGRLVFLENNPVGQFLFVERAVPELRMTAALAACLIRGTEAS